MLTRKFIPIAAALAMGVMPAAELSANGPTETGPQAGEGRNPYAHYWDDPSFVKSFMGSYGIATELEPKLTRDEQLFYEELRPLLQEDPGAAARQIESRLRPESSALLNFLLASVYFQTGEPAKALPQYENAVAKFPNFRRAHKNLGFALAQSGEFETAITHLTKTIELGGGDSSVFGLLGYAYLNQDRYLSAEAAYRNALLHAPDNLDWKLGLIKTLVATGGLEPAADLLDELLAAHPEKADLWTLQAGLYLQMEQPIQAAVNYEMVRKLEKADAKTLMLLGDIYMSQEARDLALPAYLEAIRIGGTDLAPGFRAAEILASRGAWPETSTLLEEIRTRHPTPGEEDELKLLKLEGRVQLAGDQPEKGAETLESVVERDPLNGQALLMLGDYYARNGEREKADFRYDLASKVSGFEAEAFVKRAQLLVQNQNYVQALELLRRAQQLKPRDHIQRYLEKVEAVARNSGS